MTLALVSAGCGGDTTSAADSTSAVEEDGNQGDAQTEGDAEASPEPDAGPAASDDTTTTEPPEDSHSDAGAEPVPAPDEGDTSPVDIDEGDAQPTPPEDGDTPTGQDGDTGPVIEADSDVTIPEPPSDMDGDGIPDNEDPDMDGDGYSNDDEMHAGTDPMDADSVIYIGGWPYNQHKDDIVDPGWGSEPDLGTIMPNYQALDQHGDLVNLYDFAQTGKPVVLDVVTWFCEPCKAMADYFSNGYPSVMDDFAFFADKYDIIRDLIVNGDIHWITIMWSASTPMEQADAALWEETWPSGFVTVLADTNLQLQEYLYVKAMPRIDILDEHMTFVAYCDNDVPCDSEIGGGPGGPGAGLKWLESYYKSLYDTP